MARVVENVPEKVIVHVGNQLRRRGIVGGVQAEANGTSHRCFKSLFIRRAGETPPSPWCVQQLGEDAVGFVACS